MYLRLRRRRRPFSIRPVPIRCRNRHTGRSRQRHRGPLPDIPDMWLRRRWVNARRARPFALGHGHQLQKTTRSTIGAAPRSSVQHRSLIPIITILSGMAMVAPGSDPGTDIGSEHRPVRDRPFVIDGLFTSPACFHSGCGDRLGPLIAPLHVCRVWRPVQNLSRRKACDGAKF